ncbi:hypothetical protein SapgrDRAFT_0506 [Saprospira grandis DSM 2844]|uniref:Uncharacterized protein n=1 Tax=Saprospira grandis DSM 2844 TaxID=694433 RepID=J1I0R5_9BACT|nr:hypothetical protein SapgrDRAFT_0506 [Saprospira grandis DSM 2844]
MLTLIIGPLFSCCASLQGTGGEAAAGLAMRKGGRQARPSRQSLRRAERIASPDNKDFSPQFDDQRE